MRTTKPIQFTKAEQKEVSRLARGRNTAQKVVLRAKIILKKMEGMTQEVIATELGTMRVTVGLWLKRYQEGGITALLKDAYRSGMVFRLLHWQ